MININTSILVADDEKNIADAIGYALKREQYTVYVAYDGEEAMNYININKPDILILDVMMPKLNGFDICKKINEMSCGIIMLTAKTSLVDKILGLELGADDYITKPFDIQELIARVRSLSRRINKSKGNTTIENNILIIKDLMVNYDERSVYIKDVSLDLKPKEYELLAFLLQNPKITFSRDIILDRVWEQDYYGGTRTIDIHIQRIRKKLGVYGSLIKTVPKIGYKAVNSIDEI